MSFTMNERMKERCPNLAKYIEKYGSDNLPYSYIIPPRFNNNVDEFCKYCLEVGKPWNEIIDAPKNVIL